MTTTKTTAAPVRYVDGDVAVFACCPAHGPNAHIYYGKTGAWSGRCGFIYPETPPVPHRLREPFVEVPWTAPAQPTGVRVRLQDGTSETLPLASRALEVVVREQGGNLDEPERLVVRRAVHEVASLTFTYQGEHKS